MTPFLEVVERREVGVELTTVRRGWRCLVSVEASWEEGRRAS
jgi:hypothetical protein